MKVSELIEQLKKYPQDAEVIFGDERILIDVPIVFDDDEAIQGGTSQIDPILESIDLSWGDDSSGPKEDN